LLGYGLASAARPLVALATAPWHVLSIRFADRVGKGLRSAPRDALLAGVTPAADRGRAFGFHRAMDHLGAVLGPLVATAALAAGASVRLASAPAPFPGAPSLVVLALGVREAPRSEAAASAAADAAGQGLPPGLTRFLAVLAVFALGNSADAFLLLRAQ